MKVYIEYVILDNFVIDVMVLYFALFTSRISRKWYLLTLGGILGAATALILPRAEAWGALPALAMKIAASFLITGCSAKYNSIAKYLLTLLFFYLYTFLFGGICMGILYLTGCDTAGFVTLRYDYQIPVGVIVGSVFFGGLAVKLLVEYLFRKRAVTGCLRKVELYYGDNMVQAEGFLDTGNRFYDQESGLPVILLKAELTAQLLAGVPPKGHFAVFHTMAGASRRIFLFKLDKLLVYRANKVHKIEEVMAGTAEDTACFGGEYEVLLHSEFAE